MMQCYGQLKRHRLRSAPAPGASAWKPAPSSPLHPWKTDKATSKVLVGCACGRGSSRHRFAHRCLCLGGPDTFFTPQMGRWGARDPEGAHAGGRAHPSPCLAQTLIALGEGNKGCGRFGIREGCSHLDGVLQLGGFMVQWVPAPRCRPLPVFWGSPKSPLPRWCS